MLIRGPNGKMMMMLLHIREPLAILGFQKKIKKKKAEKKTRKETKYCMKGFKNSKSS
jgi:hypothetical protein